MDNLKQLINNLSDYWEITPEKVVDRLNFMNESEINKIVNKMVNKFRTGGVIDCLRRGGKTYAECKKCGGKMPIKAYNGAAAPATYWDRVAQQNGFESAADVAEWQKAVGLPADGKFGKQSAAKLAEIKGASPMNRTTGAVLPSISAPAMLQTVGNQGLAGFAPKPSTELVEEPAIAPRYSRDDALDAGQDLGFSRRQARASYRNMKNNLRDQGLRGRELRQTARGNMVNLANSYQASGFSRPTLGSGPAATLNIGTPTLGNPAGLRSADDMVNSFIGNASNFDSAFGRARKAGLKEFSWKGKRYNTKLKSEEPAAVTTPVTTPASTGTISTGTTPSYPVYTAAPDAGMGEWGKMAMINNAMLMK